MNILGVSAGFHDAAMAVISPEGDILFAGHSERYSRKKNDADLCTGIVQEIFGMNIGTVAYYEKPWLKASRIYLGGGSSDWKPRYKIPGLKPKTFKHHYSHACAGYYTSPFDDAVIVVADAIVMHDYYQILIIPAVALGLAAGSIYLWTGMVKLNQVGSSLVEMWPQAQN